MKNVNYKTLVPALVGAGVLVYQAVTGHVVTSNVESEIANDLFNAVGVVLTVMGVIQSHKKG